MNKIILSFINKFMIEAKKIEFSKYMQETYASKGINLEIIDNIITEVR